ncbi:MAG TPA: HypC/HybG/HupF family hydrogenase formation chaperone [Patescibacteria group bacterium]|nr:HypC/HybG/HupF family hydrogenase formation chaperone [Patescibacteria group bacterium]
MCLSIPKKVISVGKMIKIQPYNSKKIQEAPAIIKVKKGDWVFTQNNIIIDKISNNQAQEIINLMKKS